MFAPHHHAAASAVVALLTQCLVSVFSITSGPRVVEAFSALGACAAVTASYLMGENRMSDVHFGRRGVSTMLLFSWSARLGAHLWLRNRPPRVPATALAFSRALWSAGAALPVVLLVASPQASDDMSVSASSLAAACAAAIALEAFADADKMAWHADPPKDGSPILCRRAWAWSRHPNLFGECAVHASLCALASPGTAMAWLPRSVTLAMVTHVLFTPYGPFVSLERAKAVIYASDQAYNQYVQNTSPFIPLPAWVWANTSSHLKTCLLERKDWARNAGAALLVAATAV